MERDIVLVDEELCDGCGNCVPGCHEGALQIIDGKARLISDLMCDGLGACLGHCPQGAMTIERREAEPYNETKVMELMVDKGINTVLAHMKHLKDHNETVFLKEAVTFLTNNQENINFDVNEVIMEVHNSGKQEQAPQQHHGHLHTHGGGGCPGSQAQSFTPAGMAAAEPQVSGKSELQQWPVQLHLLNPQAPYFKNADVLMAADCVAFSMGNFHQDYLKGKTLAIACPKLDNGLDSYVEKMTAMIDLAHINTLTVMIMEVPCCSGLMQMAQTAVAKAQRKVPIKALVISLQGEVISEEWV